MTENTNKKHPPGDGETRGIAEVIHVGADLAAIATAWKVTHPPKPPKPPENK